MSNSPKGSAALISLSFTLAVILLAAFRTIPWFVPGMYAGMSLIAFVGYGRDKRAAKRGQWRTSEGTLLLFGLLCGWPGGLVAQQVFRHKTRKQPFRALFWASVIANVAALIGFTAHALLT